MQSKKERERLGREKLAQIVESCRAVEERSLDPFLIDVNDDINKVKECFPEWTIPEDLCLDAETIYRLASVIKLQGDWVKHRSTSLYTDPFLLEEKLIHLPKEEIVGIFSHAWHPVVEMEQISLHSIAEAIAYWMNLLPIDERWKQISPVEVVTGSATREELVQERILRDKAFSEELEDFWQQLKARVAKKSENGRIHYWDFVGADTYEETVDRAFMTSFLITYGYATLEIYPLQEETFIKPFEKPQTKLSSKQLVSVPIPVPVEEWMKWKKGAKPE